MNEKLRRFRFTHLVNGQVVESDLVLSRLPKGTSLVVMDEVEWDRLPLSRAPGWAVHRADGRIWAFQFRRRQLDRPQRSDCFIAYNG